MGELLFVGAGLSGVGGLGPAVLGSLGAARAVFAEEFTALYPPGTLDALETALRRPIVRLDRAAVEDGRAVLDALDGGGTVALLVPGDPFAVTTHVALRVAAEGRGHAWRYLPHASVVSAVPGFLGLMGYRFGRPVSIPFPDPRFRPGSPFERIGMNRSQGLHTLVLLDLAPAEGRFLSPGEAIRRLLDEPASGVAAETPLGVAARVGTDTAAGWWGPAGRLAATEFGPPMHAVVVPAPTLHFEEEAAVARFRGREP